MVKASDLFKQTGQQDDKKPIKASELFSTNDDKGDLFTSQDNTKNIKESLKDTDRNRFGIIGDVWDSVTGIFGELGDLVEYGWTVATNKNKDWGINDYNKYKEYSTKMSESKSEQEYSNLYQQMVNENVIDEQKYNQYIKDQQNDKDYKFTQAKEEGKNVFNTKIDAELSSIMSQASNRYQIDAISKGVDSIKDQYSMAYENVMNAYKDTRDDRILTEWEKTSKQYEKDIIEVTKQWAEEIVKGKTYGDAYSTTIDNFATKKLANEAVNLERSMTNKLYKYTLERNFNDAGEYLSTGNLFQTINSSLLGVKNLITWGLQQVNFGIEEAKQFATDRYDIAEELANVYVFDENASGFTKTLGGAKWVGNWVLDSLPNLAPVVGELLLTRKVPGGILKKLDKAIDGMKLQSGFTRAGFRTFSRITSEFTMDNLVYDTSVQTIVGHPITGEEENVNLLFNGVIDSAQAFLHVPAKYFNQALKKSDVITNTVSQETLNLVKKLEDDAKNLNLITEGYVLLRGQEITEGTKLNKAANKVKFNLEELEKTDPELVNKIRQIQNEAALYTERMKAYQGKIDDYLLTIEDLKNRKELSKMSTNDQLLEVAEKNIRESKVIRELKDYLLAGAKSTSITFKNALNKGTITEQELRNSIKKFTDVKGFDDLVVGLATDSPIVRDAGIAKIAEEGNNLTRGDINLLYNSAIKDLIEKKVKQAIDEGKSKVDDFLDEGEFIGTFKKIGDNKYVDMYGAIDDGKGVYTLDEVLGSISTEINTLSKKSGLMSTVGGDKFLTYDSITRAYEQANAEIGLGAKKLDDEYDLLPTLQGIGGLNLEGWISKSDAEKSLIKDILSKVGFTVREEDGQLKGIMGIYGGVEKIYNDIKGLSTKKINDFNEEDVAAYKLLFFGDIYDSFKSYIGRNKMSSPTVKFNASEFQKEFTTFFEKQFDKLPDGKYKIKRAFQNKDEINAMYQSMFAHNATFKEVEEYAATNLIKNILATSVKLGEEDAPLYNKIKGLICKGHYTNGNEKEVMPVVNSLFNQAKWLKEMGVSDKGIEQISEVFGELITDPATITSLSLLNSDYLYKGIISRLILGKTDGGAIYKDSLMKLFSQIPENAPAELTNSIKTLSREVEKLTANDMAQADKQVLLNRIQDSFSLSKVRINTNSQYWTNKFKKGGVEAKGGIFNIPRASRLTDENIDDLSTMLASVIYAKNNLPKNGLLDRLKDGIKRTLENARIQNVKKMQFSIGQTSGISKDGVINLSLLSDVYLMQLLRDPDNVFQMIVGNAMLNKTINDSINIFEKYKALKDIEIPEDMKKMLNGLQGYIEGGFEKSNNELVNDLTRFIKDRGLAHKGNIINKLKSLRDSSMGMSLKDKQQLQEQIDRNINTIDNIINILAIPGNPANANRTAQQLYQTRALLRRGKELLFSKMDESTFESELSKSLDSVEQFKKMPLSSYDGVVSESPTVVEVWGKEGSTNNLLFDDPLEYKYKAFKNKKLVILDTETTGLDDDAEIIQLAYRVLDIGKDGRVKKISKKSETYKFNQDKMSEWSKNNVVDKGIKEGTKTFKEGKLYKQLQALAEDKNTYFVGHNLGFDKGRLAYHGIDIGDRNIDTSMLAKALLPVSKNHQQETLTQILEPISNAVNRLKGREGLQGSHHNAVVDVLELQAVLPYLMNHAVKNNKTEEASLLKFMRDVTKKMWKEKDDKIISANALPFYRLEKDWSNIRKTGKKQWFYKPLEGEDSEALFKIGTLANQMFGGNMTREYIDKAYDALKEKAAINPSKVLNIHDVINTLADKLGDPRAVYALNKLKSKIDIDAVIDTNKVLMGEEVKDAFVKAQDVFPELTFAEYCTNRLVANILSTVGIYNQNTIDSLNKTLLKNVRTASLSKLIDGKNGSSDVEPIMQFIKALGDNHLLNLGEKGSPEYDKAIKDILGQLEDVGTEKETYDVSEKLILKNGGIAKDEVEFVAKDEDGKPLVDLRKEGVSYKVKEFNKALYTFLKKDTEENRLNLETKFNRIIDELFGDEGFLKEYAVGRGYYDLIGENKAAVTVDKNGKIVNLNKDIKDVERQIGIYEAKVNYRREVEARANRLIAEGNRSKDKAKIDEGKRLMKEFQDAPNYDEQLEHLKQERDEYLRIKNIKEEAEVNPYKSTDDNGTTDEESFEGEGVLENKILGDQVTKQNDLSDVSQSAVDTVNAYGENLKDTNLMFQDLLSDEDFMDTVLKGDILTYNNMFLIDETNESAKNYLKTSYNGIVSTLAIGNEKNKDSLIEFTSKKMNEIQKKIDNLEAQFNSTSKDNKKLREELQDKAKKLNAVKSYYYNAFSTLNGVRSSTTPQELIELDGFSKDILGRWTFNGKITGVRMSVKGPDNKEIFNTELFGGRDFDRMAFINSYINAIYKKAQATGGDGTIDIIYKTEKVDGKESEIIQPIKGEELFNTRVGDYILREFGLGTSKVDYEGGDKVLGALDVIKKQLDNYGGDNRKWQKFRIWHLKGKDGPRREWDEQDWIEGLNFSSEAYTYYKHLPEEQQVKYVDTIKKYLDDNSIEYKGFDEDTIRLYLDNYGPTDSLDDIIKEAKYDSAGELMYKEVIKPILDRNNDNPLTKEIDNIMRPLVKSDEYKHNVDSKYKTSIAKYNIDTYLSLKAPEYLWESEFEKKLSYEIKNGDKSLRVVGLKQKFYEVEDTRDYDAHGTVLGNTVDVQNKILRGEPVPYADHMGKDIVDIIEPNIYIVDAEQRNRLLRSLEPSQPRNIFEYVYDDDTTKVLLTDENGNMYEGILHTQPGSRGIEDNNFTGEAGKMNLTDVRPVDSDSITSTVNEGYWINQEGKLASGLKGEDKRWEEAQKKDRKTGQWVSYDNYAENSKASRDAIAQEKQVIDELNKDGDTMDSNIGDIVPYMKREGEIWNTRILNFTNYDLYNKSEAIQQIAGRRQRLLGFKKELRDAIDNFNKSIEGLSDESKKEVYRRIRERAKEVIRGTEDVKIGEKSKTGAADMLVDGLSKETQKELFEIGKVFEAAGRDPQYQFAMLSFKNDGFEGILKNIAHNHKGAAADYFKATGDNLKEAITNEVKKWFEGPKDIKNAVEDILGDPLGTSAMFKAATGVRSLWRFIKYGPIVFPLSGVLMLANSAILGITRYASESSGFRKIMDTDAFNILVAKKGDLFQLSNGKHVEGLGFTDGINRVDEIMFNSNSDLGGSWFDKCLDWILNKIPENNGFMKRTKEIVTTAMKGGTHSLFDLFAQGSVKTMELAKSLEKNLPAGMNINEFVARLQSGNIDSKLVNKILADTEKGYSRFFTNSATSLFSRHKFSRWYMFNALQGYVINRTDEVFSSIKDCINWIGRQQALYNRNGGKGIAFNWKDFVNYINTDNQELKGLLMNVLLSAKLGFYMDRLVNGGDFSGKEYSDYMIDTSDYLSSLPATFFYGILTAPVAGIEDYAEYVRINNEDFNIGDGITVAGMNTVSQVMSKFFREGKVLNAFMDSIVAYGKTGDIDFAYDVLEGEFANIANGLGRFQLVEGTNKYGLDNLTSESDMLGQILFNADKVSESGRLTNDLYSLQTVDSILNGESGDYWKNRLLPYIPLIGNILQNSITGSGYTFTAAKWKELQHIMDKDEVVQILNNWDYDKMQDYQGLWWDEGIYTNEAVGRMYKELTAFNYPYKGRKNGTEFKTGYEGELEQIKETVFTDEILRGLGWTEEDLTNYLNQAPDRKKAGLMKIMAASEAARPGSSKIVLSYLANQEEYELLKKVTGKDYPSSTDVTDEEMATIQRQVLQDYYPYMFTADKTSWYRAITEYVSNKYPLFESLYKDDDLTGYLSTLGYMDMIMYQQAKTGNVNAKFIKNSWSMLAKYMKSEPARMNAISYIMNSIENSGFSRGKATSAKMGVLAANMDFYDKIQKSGMMQALYGEDIENYNNFVWGVLKDLGDITDLDDTRKSGSKYRKGYNNYNSNPIGDNNTPTARQFVPQAQKYLRGYTPSFGGKSGYNPNSTYKPGKTLDWYRRYYEGLISTYSDRLVKSKGKKYPAQTVEGITFKTGSNNKGKIKGDELRFKKHKSKKYRTNVISNLPGSHG